MRYGLIIDDTEPRLIENRGKYYQPISKEDIKKEIEKYIGDTPMSMATSMSYIPQFFGIMGASDDEYKVYTAVVEGIHSRISITDDQGFRHSPSFIVSSSVNGHHLKDPNICIPNLTSMTYLELIKSIVRAQNGSTELDALLRKDIDKEIWNEKCFFLECLPNEHEGYMTVAIQYNYKLDGCSLLPHICDSESFEDFYRNKLHIYTMLNVACKE